MKTTKQPLFFQFMVILFNDDSRYLPVWLLFLNLVGSSHPEVLLRKGVPKLYTKFAGEHPCRSVISIKLLCNFIEIALRHGCSPVNLLPIFRTPFPRSTFGWLTANYFQVLVIRRIRYLQCPTVFLVNKKRSNKGVNWKAKC